MWFTSLDDNSSPIRVYIFREDISDIRSGFNPDEYDGCYSVVIKKNEEEVWILEDENELNAIIAEERRKDILFLHQ